jgi:hypothetical protein
MRYPAREQMLRLGQEMKRILPDQQRIDVALGRVHSRNG